MRTWNRPTPSPPIQPRMIDPFPSPSGVVLLPSDRFFVRLVPLAAGVAQASQISLALETLAPFPPAQLYYGWLLAPAGDQALVFAAYRQIGRASCRERV